jgi:hypothetical protein
MTQTSLRPSADGDPHLRSSRAVTGHHIEARDGEIGHVEDFLVDDETWAIRYIVIGTHNWLPGKHVLLGPEWVDEIDWASSTVRVDVDRDQIKHAPEFDASAPIARDYEKALHARITAESRTGQRHDAPGRPRCHRGRRMTSRAP